MFRGVPFSVDTDFRFVYLPMILDLMFYRWIGVSGCLCPPMLLGIGGHDCLGCSLHPPIAVLASIGGHVFLGVVYPPMICFLCFSLVVLATCWLRRVSLGRFFSKWAW